ncbi:MAG: hypothetical protein H5T69_03130 [Chloroflexi bacterium]|nr:hypothetical protein [Chloroflexota bacterium]
MAAENRLGALLSLLMLGMILSLIVPLASYELSFVVLGSEIALRLTPGAQFAVVLAGLVASGAEAIARARQPKPIALPRSVTFCPLPTALALSGMVLMQRLPTWEYQVLMATTTTAVVALIMQLQARVPSSPYSATQIVLQVSTYASAAVLFVALYGTRTRSLLSASGVSLVASGLALERLRESTGQLGRIWLYALLLGLMMGELTWALNYYLLPSRIGGGALLLAFYLLTGLVHEYLADELKTHVIVEHLLVGIAGLAILAGYARWVAG